MRILRTPLNMQHDRFEICLAIAYNRPQFSSCSAWNSTAITFANYTTNGSSPVAIFVDWKNTVYASIAALNQVQVWSESSTSPTRSLSGNLSQPQGLFVTSNGDIYVDNGASNGRIDRWTPIDPMGTFFMSINDTCSSLFLDLSNNMYCSFSLQHRVIMGSTNITATTMVNVAGNGSSGSGAFMLNTPQGIFVNLNLDLYVADCGNNRIQLFPYGQLNGTTVAGNGSVTGLVLNCPWAIVLDADSRLYISDQNNHRLIRSRSGYFQCLFGCSGSNGSATDQFNSPRAISFDSYGNIFVVDWGNQRIQKVLLSTNTCGKTVDAEFPK